MARLLETRVFSVFAREKTHKSHACTLTHTLSHCRSADDGMPLVGSVFSLVFLIPYSLAETCSEVLLTQGALRCTTRTDLVCTRNKGRSRWARRFSPCLFSFQLSVHSGPSFYGLAREAFLMCTQRGVRVKAGSFQASI